MLHQKGIMYMVERKKRRECDIKKILEYQNYLKLNQTHCEEDMDNLYEKYVNSQGEEKIKIRNLIVEKNLSLILDFIIKKYNYSYDVNPVFDLDDVIQEGNLLLLKSIESYNPNRGSFSTYIYKILFNLLFYALGIPNSAFYVKRGTVGRYKEVKKLIDLDYSDEYILEHVQISPKLLKRLRPVLASAISYQQLEKRLSEEHLNNKLRPHVYIDDLEFGRILEETNIEKRNKAIWTALNNLKPKERELVIHVFGLDGKMPMSVYEANDLVGYSKSYVADKFRSIKHKLERNMSLNKVKDIVDIDYDKEDQKTYFLKK